MSLADRYPKLARWGFFAAAAFGFLWLGPRAQGRTLTLDAKLEHPACVSRLTIDVTRDRQRARASRVRVDRSARVHWQGRLPADRYRLSVGLECDSGLRTDALSRPVDLEDGDLEVPLTVTASCACD